MSPAGPSGCPAGRCSKSAAALSSALDVETEAELWPGLLSRDRATTVLAVSHRRPALMRADQVLVMDAGRVAAAGKAGELSSTSPIFREMWAGD